MIFKLCLALVLIACFVSVSVAAETKEQVKPKAVEVKQDEDMVKKIKEAEKELNNTKWQINLSQITQAEKKDKFTDALLFKDGKVEMESLKSQGFSASGFTITVKGDNIIVWETMQTSEKKGLAFWKGEIEEGRMRGVLSRHFDEKTVKDYSFYSTGKEIIQEEASIAAVPPPAAAAEEVKKEDMSKGKDKKKKDDKR
ncbi:MAG: hypothetical protein NTX47_05460 [Candidatus Omnitrophica bacterium]|nr:hypothetical protein [Candidatus Omnitrophota bacterium]